MFKKTFLLSTLVAALSFNAILPTTQAFAAKPSDVVTTGTAGVTTDHVEAAGKWGLLVRGALVAIKSAIKYGGDALSYVVKWLDADTAKYLSNNSSKIANGIDNAIGKINELTDYTTATIRGIILDGLRLAGVPDKYGVGIAEAIATTVDWLLL
ncbi:hypothetical protein P5G65_26200 [Paenibacillus chondroitinus]|uniref:Secreted protein n=1 Tax=Paenibacillus chondroitinus TaxID=59842 RepID=A0ABU6DK90_9BACL|nr:MULTISPECIES: hypothetical protein [Paenibacillus]MCY9657614.1 hypothetical protein [Paenibacillus anseongense]MEB4797403.1 hypothetical protein [Paenibacillus chondroitinus]